MATSILAGISSESTQEELLFAATYYLSAILETLPRVDANNRAIVNTSDQGNVTVAIAATQTLATVTTVATVTKLSNIGTNSVPADPIPSHLSNAGTMHLYNNILVS